MQVATHRSSCNRPQQALARVVSPESTTSQAGHVSNGTASFISVDSADVREPESLVEAQHDNGLSGGHLEADSAVDDEDTAADRRVSGAQASTSADGPRKTVRLIRGPGGRIMRAGDGEDAAQGSSLRSSPRVVHRAAKGASEEFLSDRCQVSLHAACSSSCTTCCRKNA